jgi:hypothetical protein
LVVALLNLALFFVGYRFSDMAATCGSPTPAAVAGFWSLLWNAFFQLNFRGLVGFAIPAAILAGAATTLVLRLRHPADGRYAALLLIFGFSLAFSTSVALGRACFGVGAAQAPRYVPFLVPAFYALYLLLRLPRVARWGEPLAVAYLFFTTFYLAANGSFLTERRLDHAVKMDAWRACYLQEGDASTCDAQAGITLEPERPTSPTIARWLEQLRQRHLGPFNGR